MNLEELFTLICISLGYNYKEVRTKSRKTEHIFVRHIFSYIAYTYYKHSKASIGRYLFSDHTVQGYAINRIQNLIDDNDNNTVKSLNIIASELNIDFENDFSSHKQLEKKYNDLFKEYARVKLDLRNAQFEIKKLELENKKLKVLYA